MTQIEKHSVARSVANGSILLPNATENATERNSKSSMQFSIFFPILMFFIIFRKKKESLEITITAL